MRNECPDLYSCGSYSGAWYSPSALPTNLYETVDIVILERFQDDDCDDNDGIQKGRATRCPMDKGALCGMD